MVEVSNHTLVPEHKRLSDEEVGAVLEEYGVERTDLPKIKVSDPALPEEATAGDVIRIIRDSRTTDQAVSYRLVIE